MTANSSNICIAWLLSCCISPRAEHLKNNSSFPIEKLGASDRAINGPVYEVLSSREIHTTQQLFKAVGISGYRMQEFQTTSGLQLSTPVIRFLILFGQEVYFESRDTLNFRIQQLFKTDISISTDLINYLLPLYPQEISWNITEAGTGSNISESILGADEMKMPIVGRESRPLTELALRRIHTIGQLFSDMKLSKKDFQSIQKYCKISLDKDCSELLSIFERELKHDNRGLEGLPFRLQNALVIHISVACDLVAYLKPFYQNDLNPDGSFNGRQSVQQSDQAKNSSRPLPVDKTRVSSRGTRILVPNDDVYDHPISRDSISRSDMFASTYSGDSLRYDDMFASSYTGDEGWSDGMNPAFPSSHGAATSRNNSASEGIDATSSFPTRIPRRGSDTLNGSPKRTNNKNVFTAPKTLAITASAPNSDPGVTARPRRPVQEKNLTALANQPPPKDYLRATFSGVDNTSMDLSTISDPQSTDKLRATFSGMSGTPYSGLSPYDNLNQVNDASTSSSFSMWPIRGPFFPTVKTGVDTSGLFLRSGSSSTLRSNSEISLSLSTSQPLQYSGSRLPDTETSVAPGIAVPTSSLPIHLYRRDGSLSSLTGSVTGRPYAYNGSDSLQSSSTATANPPPRNTFPGPLDSLSNSSRGPLDSLSNSSRGPLDSLSNGSRGSLGSLWDRGSGPLGSLSDGSKGPLGSLSDGSKGPQGSLSDGSKGPQGLLSDGSKGPLGSLSDGSKGPLGLLSNGVSRLPSISSEMSTVPQESTCSMS